MSYNQYWHGDCCLVKYYRQAYRIQRDRENEKMWLQGMYIYEALCDVAPIIRAFAKKGTTPIDYPSQPYAITKEEVERRKQEKEKAKYDRIKAKTSAFMVEFNAQIANRKEVNTHG